MSHLIWVCFAQADLDFSKPQPRPQSPTAQHGLQVQVCGFGGRVMYSFKKPRSAPPLHQAQSWGPRGVRQHCPVWNEEPWGAGQGRLEKVRLS